MIEANVVVEPRIPTGGTEASQTAEYLRGFLGGRIAWSRMNGLLIISGAFGVFRRDLLRGSGGLSKGRSARTWRSSCACTTSSGRRTRKTRIAYAADATVWTEVPTGLARCARSGSAGMSA